MSKKIDQLHAEWCAARGVSDKAEKEALERLQAAKEEEAEKAAKKR